MTPIDVLSASMGGRWEVTTETSTYLLDLDAAVLVRVPGTGSGPMPGRPPDIAVSELRKDHEPIPLVELATCQVGASMVAVIDVRKDGILTVRRTTLVRGIRRLH